MKVAFVYDNEKRRKDLKADGNFSCIGDVADRWKGKPWLMVMKSIRLFMD